MDYHVQGPGKWVNTFVKYSASTCYEYLNKIPAPLQYLKIITRCDNLVANVVTLSEICKVALSNTDMEFFI